jgi:Icc-related predicted phosphoesterase
MARKGNRLKLVLISDTHTMHERVQLLEGDVLVHAGDMCSYGSVQEAQDCLDWLDRQPFEHVVAIAGNHDWAFAKPEMKEQLRFGRINYLENSSVNIGGKNFYGSPVQPEFCNWAFNVARGEAIKKCWDMIPENVDILITHGPPRGILDQAASHLHTPCLGCDDLFEAVERVNPKIHVFGHIHGGYGKAQFGDGTKFFNASVVNEAYKVTNRPWEVEI